MKAAAAVQRQQGSVRGIVAHAERAAMHVRQRVTHHSVRASEAAGHYRKPNHRCQNQQHNRSANPLQQFSASRFTYR
jgi:hypothetical protein